MYSIGDFIYCSTIWHAFICLVVLRVTYTTDDERCGWQETTQMYLQNRAALLLVLDMERKTMGHHCNVSCSNNPILGEKVLPCNCSGMVISGLYNRSSTNSGTWLPQIVWGLYLHRYFCCQDNDARSAFRTGFDFVATLFQTILHNQIIVCDMMAGNVLTQSCLKIGTIATLALHKVLLHAETMSNCAARTKLL